MRKKSDKAILFESGMDVTLPGLTVSDLQQKSASSLLRIMPVLLE